MKRLIRLAERLNLSYSSERWFYWTGLSALGELKSGHISAHSRAQARQKLRAQMIILKKLSLSFSVLHPLRARDITDMLQQLVRIMQTGMTLQHALPILSTCFHHMKLQHLILKIQQDITGGARLAESLTRYSRCFDRMVCTFVHLGEQSGSLPSILEKIVQHQNKMHAVKQRLKLLSIYPILVIMLSCVITVYLLLTVVPQIQLFFRNAHQPLPTTTQFLLHCANGIQDYGLVGSMLGIVLGLFCKNIYCQFFILKSKIDHALIKIPVWGPLYRSLCLARAFQVLAMSLETGIPLLDGLQFAAQINHHAGYQYAFLHLRNVLQRGESLRSALEHTTLFPNLVLQLLCLGEESGTLVTQTRELAEYYAHSLDNHLQYLSRCIEPILMLILGIIIGGLILCLYLPMIQLGAVL